MTLFRPNQKSKMARNGKTNMNPTGSSHGEQLQPKRLTLLKRIPAGADTLSWGKKEDTGAF